MYEPSAEHDIITLMSFVYLTDNVVIIIRCVIVFGIIGDAIYMVIIISIFCTLCVGAYIYVHKELIPGKIVYYHGVYIIKLIVLSILVALPFIIFKLYCTFLRSINT